MGKITMHAVDVRIETYYSLSGSHILFPDNELNGRVYHNADVVISAEKRNIYGQTFVVDVITINQNPPIECELVRTRKDANGLLIL